MNKWKRNYWQPTRQNETIWNPDRSNLWHPIILRKEAGGLFVPQNKHLLRKIWVQFRAVRFVMCRQPQQKSGSKQPWSNWYDHQTEEAMPLGGQRQRRQVGRRRVLGYWPHLLSFKTRETPLPVLWKWEGKHLTACSGENKKERVSLKTQTKGLPTRSGFLLWFLYSEKC